MKIELWLALLVVSTLAVGESNPPPSVSATVDREVTTIEGLVIGAAEAMPEAEFNFSPETLKIQRSDYQDVRSFAAELKHIGASNYLLWSPVTGDKLPGDVQNGSGPEKLKSKAEIVQFVKE